MATTNTCSSLLVAVSFATAVVCAFAPLPVTADCPWITVPHPEASIIQGLGQWAVDQVEQQGGVLHFDKVESAKEQGVSHCTRLSRTSNYELIIDASLRPNSNDKYRAMAVVYVTNFTQPQELITFRANELISPPAN